MQAGISSAVGERQLPGWRSLRNPNWMYGEGQTDSSMCLVGQLKLQASMGAFYKPGLREHSRLRRRLNFEFGLEIGQSYFCVGTFCKRVLELSRDEGG